MNKYKNLDILSKSKSVCLITHLEPDVDALASMIVFADFIKQHFNIPQVDIFSDFSTLPESYNILLEGLKINKKPKKYDTAIMLDAPNTDRLGQYKQLFNNAKLKIVIDHHATNDFSGDINIVEFVSSTCEIVYGILKTYKFSINKTNLENIYAGIITDTNNFSVGLFNDKTFIIASEIANFIDVNMIYSHYFSNTSLKSMKVLAKSIENIEVFSDNQIIFSHITKNQAQKLNIELQDYEGLINKIATIHGNKFVCFVYPKNNEYYVSLRAKNGYDVSIVAKNNGGGGHIGASAFTSAKSLKQIKNIVLFELLKQL